MHLHSNTDATPLRIAYTTTGRVTYTTQAPEPDTFCEREYQALCETVAATHLGGDLVTTVQTAVTNAYMTRRERWQAEARQLLEQYGLLPDQPALMAIAR